MLDDSILHSAGAAGLHWPRSPQSPGDWRLIPWPCVHQTGAERPDW